MSHRIMCSGFFQPSYKRGKYLFLKGAIKGQIVVAMRYNLLLFISQISLYLLYLLQFVTIRYNLLISK
nr:MAG TPA: hypothetical protein [Caudoviricetes sp.]